MHQFLVTNLSIYLSIYLYILPYALADILGRVAHGLLVIINDDSRNGGVLCHIASSFDRDYLPWLDGRVDS